MATFTAQILVGERHPTHDGVIPTHLLLLQENNRPAWVLLPIPGSLESRIELDPRTWITSPHRLIEDALLMVGMLILSDRELLEEAGDLVGTSAAPVDVSAVVPPQQRALLDKRFRQVDTDREYKLAITVLEGSSLLVELPRLADYYMDLEVCTTTFFRARSAWDHGPNITGTLGP